MISLSRLCHQVDAEMNALALGHKEDKKAIDALKEINVKIDRSIQVSDSQTCLSLCSKPAATLDLSTSLIVNRVQALWSPHMDNLYFAPRETFSQNKDLLTRYQPDLAEKITAEFYSPTWMKKEIPERVTVNIASMRGNKRRSPFLASVPNSRCGPS
jgi:hypothetical protein